VLIEKIDSAGEYKDKAVQNYCADTPGNQYTGGYHNPPWIDANGYEQNAVAQPFAIWTRFTTRHNHGGNILFADGHVSWFAWTDVQVPNSQLPYSKTSDANQYSKIIWCPLGPTN
jgi:prepilin-type processing-associated H-X9-DG protein